MAQSRGDSPSHSLLYPGGLPLFHVAAETIGRYPSPGAVSTVAAGAGPSPGLGAKIFS